ncbi:MAG: hemolysin family protein [Planctomycetia bacterium]|nr:hemolysin family protein [Planctomycetia bacterium]
MWSVFLLSLSIALAISFLCSLCEAALLSLTPGQLEEIGKKNPSKGRIWRKYRENVEEPIAAILILNTSAHTIGATVAGASFTQIVGGNSLYVTIFSIVFTYLMLQYTEILPKTLGVRYNVRFALLFTRTIRTLVGILRPVIYFIHLVNRPFESRGVPKDSPLNELIALVRFVGMSKLINKTQVKIVEEASRLRSRTAREIMIPVEQIAFLSTTQNNAQALVVAHLDPHTRFPLLENGDVNKVVGYVNLKELVSSIHTRSDNSSLRSIARKVHFIPETEPLTEVLLAFVNQHAHIAIVRDENQNTVGLITIEDILEELVGDLEDEFDRRLPKFIDTQDENILQVGGGAKVSDILAELGLQGDSVPPNQTLSQWILAKCGGVPAPNTKVYFYQKEVVVRRIRRDQVFDATIFVDHVVETP